MRVGFNPEKNRNKKNIRKPHRVVMVLYIPNSDEAYYKESHLVLNQSLESLFSTINPETTVVTLINNGSSESVNQVIQKFLPKIDKYVEYEQNKGKVYALLNEVKGVFEPFVTITDADVLFFEGWEKAVFTIFKDYPKAGVVSPLPVPHCAFGRNNVVFCDEWFRIKYGGIVTKEDSELFIKGIDNNVVFRRQHHVYWDVKQVYLAQKSQAIIGATHFVATYKSKLFKDSTAFPEEVFVQGYEDVFIDCLAENHGMYRLSTVAAFAYHMGNCPDDTISKKNTSENRLLDSSFFEGISTHVGKKSLIVQLKKLIGKISIKYKWAR